MAGMFRDALGDPAVMANALRNYAPQPYVPYDASQPEPGLEGADFAPWEPGSGLGGLAKAALAKAAALGPALGVLATRRAPKPSGLDMSESARMQRMAEQNYDPRWFHGYAGDSPLQVFDPALRGSVTGTPAAQLATFLTMDRAAAQQFAENAAQVTGKPPQVMQVAVQKNGIPGMKWADPDLPVRSNNGQRVLASMLLDAKDAQKPAVFISGLDDSLQGGSKSPIMAVFDTGKLRDVSRAAFDPTKIGQNGLALGLGGSAIGLSLLPYLLRGEQTE